MAKPMGHEAERLVIGFTAAVNSSRVADTIRDTEDERKIVHRVIKKMN
jgi:hypothetical protein